MGLQEEKALTWTSNEPNLWWVLCDWANRTCSKMFWFCQVSYVRIMAILLFTPPNDY